MGRHDVRRGGASEPERVGLGSLEVGQRGALVRGFNLSALLCISIQVVVNLCNDVTGVVVHKPWGGPAVNCDTTGQRNERRPGTT